MKKLFILFVLLTFFTKSNSQSISKLKSGQYEYLTLITYKQYVFGLMEYYDKWNSSTNDYENKNIFYLYGEYFNNQKDTINLVAALPEYKKVNAKIVLRKNDSITLFLPKDFTPGYGNVSFYDEGYMAHLDEDLTSEYKGLGIIKASKSYFYNEPNYNSISKMYLIKGDIVKIIDYKNEWVKIAYIPISPKINTRFVKWIKSSDLYDKNPNNWKF